MSETNNLKTTPPGIASQGGARRPSSRVFSFDLMRLFAILAILGMHVFAPAFGKYLSGEDAFNVRTFVSYAGSLAGMASFMFISGYFSWTKVYRRGDLKPFFTKKIRSLVIPYLLMSLFYLAFSFLVLDKGATVKSTVIDLMTGTVYYHMHFMPPFIVLTFLSPFVSKVIEKAPGVSLVVGTSASLGAAVLILVRFPHFADPTTYNAAIIFVLYRVMLFFSSFLMGAWFFHRRSARFFERYAWIASLLLIGGGILVRFGFTQTTATWGNLLVAKNSVAGLLVVLGLALAFVGIAKLGWKRSLVSFIKRLSTLGFGVYLIHPAVLTLSSLALKSWGYAVGDDLWVDLCLFVFVAITSFAVSAAFESILACVRRVWAKPEHLGDRHRGPHYMWYHL